MKFLNSNIAKHLLSLPNLGEFTMNIGRIKTAIQTLDMFDPKSASTDAFMTAISEAGGTWSGPHNDEIQSQLKSMDSNNIPVAKQLRTLEVVFENLLIIQQCSSERVWTQNADNQIFTLDQIHKLVSEHKIYPHFATPFVLPGNQLVQLHDLNLEGIANNLSDTKSIFQTNNKDLTFVNSALAYFKELGIPDKQMSNQMAYKLTQLPGFDETLKYITDKKSLLPYHESLLKYALTDIKNLGEGKSLSNTPVDTHIGHIKDLLEFIEVNKFESRPVQAFCENMLKQINIGIQQNK